MKYNNKKLYNNLQDYIELINKLQHYTCCSSSYCFCINKKGHQQCQFGYPKNNIDNTFIYANSTQVAAISLKKETPSILAPKNDTVAIKETETAKNDNNDKYI